MVTLKSDKADFAGQGVEIEPGTFIHDIGDESGVPHHYFNEAGIRDLFAGLGVHGTSRASHYPLGTSRSVLGVYAVPIHELGDCRQKTNAG